IAIQLWRDVVAERCELGSNFHLGRLIGAAEGDVMDGAGSHDAGPDSGNAPDVDNGSRAALSRGVAEDASLLANQLEAECVGEQLTGKLVGIEPESNGVDAADGVFGGDAGARPTRLRVDRWMGDELTHESFVVLEGDDALVVIASGRLLEFDPLFDQSLDPEPDGAGENRKRSDRDLSAALPAAAGIGPGKEGENAARTSRLVAEIEVIGRGIVEVDGALDQPQPEDPGVEIEISLGIAGDAGYVVDAGGSESHRAIPKRGSPGARSSGAELAFLGRLALVGTGLWR